jgi:protein-tyrosine-phosphatase
MAKRSEKTVLFLGTGNNYRSRFAEALFNSVAGRMGLPWRASSRGLAWSGASTTSARWQWRL